MALITSDCAGSQVPVSFTKKGKLGWGSAWAVVDGGLTLRLRSSNNNPTGGGEVSHGLTAAGPCG